VEASAQPEWPQWPLAVLRWPRRGRYRSPEVTVVVSDVTLIEYWCEYRSFSNPSSNPRPQPFSAYLTLIHTIKRLIFKYSIWRSNFSFRFSAHLYDRCRHRFINHFHKRQCWSLPVNCWAIIMWPAIIERRPSTGLVIRHRRRSENNSRSSPLLSESVNDSSPGSVGV